MAELLIKAVDVVHPDPDVDRRGCYKRGMVVAVMPDGHPWGSEERLPHFVVIKVPGISVERAQKYVEPQFEGFEVVPQVYRRRLWVIRWADLPAGARNKLATAGVLTIKAGTYGGAYDYTWQQVRQYFRNQFTGLDEAEDL